MKATRPEIEAYLNLLTQTSRRITKTTKGFEDARLKFRTVEQPWSVNDILAHLRSWVHTAISGIVSGICCTAQEIIGSAEKPVV